MAKPTKAQGVTMAATPPSDEPLPKAGAPDLSDVNPDRTTPGVAHFIPEQTHDADAATSAAGFLVPPTASPVPTEERDHNAATRAAGFRVGTTTSQPDPKLPPAIAKKVDTQIAETPAERTCAECGHTFPNTRPESPGIVLDRRCPKCGSASYKVLVTTV